MDKKHSCVICGRSLSEVTKLIETLIPGRYICYRCYQHIANNVEGEHQKDAAEARGEISNLQIQSPKDIKKYLDEYVIGQEQAKIAVSVAVFNHYIRAKMEENDNITDDFSSKENDVVKVEKSNILLIGPTGCGKTHIVRTLSDFLSVPVTTYDVTGLTETGYVGNDVEHVLYRLLQAAHNNLARTEIGIVYLDEIDKLAARVALNTTTGRDVSGEGVQHALLKILEDSIVEVPILGQRTTLHAERIKINTRDILFIGGGAFNGLEKMVDIENRGQIGYGDGEAEFQDGIIGPDHLIKYGFLPEFVGRLPIIIRLKALTESEMVSVLHKPRNSLIKQYQKLMAECDIDLKFESGALEVIANEAMSKSIGARGLRAVLEILLIDFFYNIDKHRGTEIVITEKLAIEKISKFKSGGIEQYDQAAQA